MAISIDDVRNANIYLEEKDTLANRIDFAWSVYTHKTDYGDDDKKKAFEFLVYAFDISDIQDVNVKLIELMAERDLYRADNPEYIPNQQLTRLPFDPRRIILKALEPHHGGANAVSGGLTKALKSAELLDVNVESKLEDEIDEVPFLSETERAAYRVHLHGGKFQKDGKNFDTSAMGSHLKLGFASFTLNANGELSVFTHTGYRMMHSSMNAGAPVVAAGELKIKDGVLVSMTTHSGHYFPTLFNVYRALEHFVLHDADIKQATVITFANPSEQLQNVSSRERTDLPYEQAMYETDAVDVYHAMNVLIEKNMHAIQSDVMKYQNAGYYNALLRFKDKHMHSDLTEQRLGLAQKFLEAVQTFQADLPEGLSKSELKDRIHSLDALIMGFQAQNEAISLSHDKSQSSGRLEKKMQDFRAQLQVLKAGDEDTLDSDTARDMKKLR
ncbi:MAG: hypothetical protein P1U61_00650 [Legionellaceae bacterium]|nr:hypothetical protein [Legionellaceae bacterium]